MEKRFFNANKKYILLLPAAIIVGAVFANFAGTATVGRWGIFSADYTDKFLSVSIEFTRVFAYVFKKRMRMYAFALLASMTKIKDKLALLICACWGFSAGVVIAALSMQYGAGYIVIFFCGILCHMILYGISICAIFMNVGNNEGKRKVLRYLVSALVYLAGMLAEAAMNRYILPAVLIRH
ncbi:MAG: hypothetical protein NC223_00100 [Butyrivibrio sp.]|nr:hypothetical protein [Butyrivibrio sp.]